MALTHIVPSGSTQPTARTADADAEADTAMPIPRPSASATSAWTAVLLRVDVRATSGRGECAEDGRSSGVGKGVTYRSTMRLTTFEVDAPLGRWTHTEWRPPHLAALVDQVWHFEGRSALPRERQFPGGYLEVILHLGPRFRDVDAAGRTAAQFPSACVTGMQLGPTVIEAPSEPCVVMGIRLRAVGAYVLLGTPADLATGTTLDLADLIGRDASALIERCHAASTVRERFQLVAQWIEGRRAVAPASHPGIAWAAQQLQTHDGMPSIAALRAQTDLGGARFAETFRRQVGLTPKRYARVLRFRRTIELLRADESLARAALAAGYYDQPHMNAEFRALAGMTPAEFVAAERYPNSASLAEAGSSS